MTGSWHYTDPGPAGYMLDVFEEGNPEITIGKFADPHPRSTAKACSDGKVNTNAQDMGKSTRKFQSSVVSYLYTLFFKYVLKTIMFKSCQPTVLDLPRTYQWTANKNVNGTVCFRYDSWEEPM